MKISGIYKIQSVIKPERIYIGSAVIIDQRWGKHLSDLRRNVHHSPKLQNHFNKYGEVDFIFSILLGCEKEDLIKTEQYFIDSYNPYFNVCKIAGSQLGIKRSNETNQKHSKATKGKKKGAHSKEHNDKISENNRGKHNGTRSNETRKIMSDSRIAYYKTDKGIATIENLVQKNKGKEASIETCQKMSNTAKKKTFSEEYKKNLRIAWVVRKANKKTA